MKIPAIFISLLLIMFACKPAAKLQKTTTVISKVDTTPVVSAKDNNAPDSAMLIKDIYNKVIKNKINFTTFNAKIKVAYNSAQESNEATAYVRLIKDSVMWLSLRGPFGIEGARVLITKDSVKIMNVLKKNFQIRDIAFLQQFTGIPINFSALQDIIVGNPVFTDSNIHSYNTDSSNHLQVLMLGVFFKHLITIDNTDYKIIHSRLDDVNNINRTCDLSYSGYENGAGVLFATERTISLAEPAKSDIQLDFKQYSFNQPVTLPFNVPSSYKRF